MYGVNALIAFGCALVLWSSGESARRWAVRGLEEKLMRAEGGSGEMRPQQLRLMLEHVRSIREGAFAPLTQHPLFLAFFVPFGGIGVTSLLVLMANIL